MRLLLYVAAIVFFVECTIEERPEDKNYIDELSVEDRSFDDLTVEAEEATGRDEQENSAEGVPLLPVPGLSIISDPSDMSTSIPQPPPTLLPSAVQETSPPLVTIALPTSPPLLVHPDLSSFTDITNSTSPDLPPVPNQSEPFPPLLDVPFVPNQSVSTPIILSPPNLSPSPEDITVTSSPIQNTPEVMTSSRPTYTILTVAVVPPFGNASNVSSTVERANFTFEMTTQTQLTTTTTPPRPRFRTTLVDEVVTFIPPSDPTKFATLVHTIPTSTSRPTVSRLNDGEVKHKTSGKTKNVNFNPRQKTSGQFRKKFYLDKAVMRIRSHRKVISRDVGPLGRKVLYPRSWKVIDI